MVRLKSYVAGGWHAGTGKPAVLVNPATEAPVAAANADGIDHEAVLAHARVAGAELRRMTWAQRAAAIKAVAKLFHTHREELLDLAALFLGRIEKAQLEAAAAARA